MSKAIPVKSAGYAILVETDDDVDILGHPIPPPQSGDSDIFIPKGAQEVVSVKDIKRELGDVKDVIVACCNDLYKAVASIPAPQKFAIEFGVKLAGEAGVPMLTKASGEANFKVTVEWGK